MQRTLLFILLFQTVALQYRSFVYAAENQNGTVDNNNNNNNAPKTDLDISFYYPSNRPDDRYCLESSLKLAVDYINRNQSILPNHTIKAHMFSLNRIVSAFLSKSKENNSDQLFFLCYFLFSEKLSQEKSSSNFAVFFSYYYPYRKIAI